MANVLRFAPGLAALLGEAALQLSGYQNVPLAIALAAFAALFLVGAAWLWRRDQKKHRDVVDPVDLLRAQYSKGRELQQTLVWPLDGAPESRDHAVEQARQARRLVCAWAKSAWRALDDRFPASAGEFYGPGDRSLGSSFFYLSCEQEINELGGQTDLYLERKLELLTKLIDQFSPRKTKEDEALVLDAREAQKRLQSELGALMHEGAGYTSRLAALTGRGINDSTIIEASYLSGGIEAWFDEGFEWVRREKPELLGLLTPIPIPTPPRAIDVLPALVEKRGKELRDVFYRL
jgi:hypothetical protein